MSKESEKHVDRVLDQISTRLESLTVSGPKLGDLSTLRSHMLRLRGLRANGTKTYAKEITNCYN